MSQLVDCRYHNPTGSSWSSLSLKYFVLFIVIEVIHRLSGNPLYHKHLLYFPHSIIPWEYQAVQSGNNQMTQTPEQWSAWVLSPHPNRLVPSRTQILPGGFAQQWERARAALTVGNLAGYKSQNLEKRVSHHRFILREILRGWNFIMSKLNHPGQPPLGPDPVRLTCPHCRENVSFVPS